MTCLGKGFAWGDWGLGENYVAAENFDLNWSHWFKASNNKNDWTPVKYQFFLKILQKYYQLPILGTLDVSDNFHQKQ